MNRARALQTGGCVCVCLAYLSRAAALTLRSIQVSGCNLKKSWWTGFAGAPHPEAAEAVFELGGNYFKTEKSIMSRTGEADLVDLHPPHHRQCCSLPSGCFNIPEKKNPTSCFSENSTRGSGDSLPIVGMASGTLSGRGSCCVYGPFTRSLEPFREPLLLLHFGYYISTFAC